MKILAMIDKETLLVEVSVRELSTATTWDHDKSGCSWSSADPYMFKPGKAFDLKKTFEQAESLIKTFRGLGPGLRQSAARLVDLAKNIELHEPDYNLLPKGDA